jgi:hypothetical protein
VPKRLSVLGLIFASLFCLLSCGLEDFSYIDYIPEGNYENVTRATVRLPSSSADGYASGSFFTNFIIFYRIYIAGITPFPTNSSQVETSQMRQDLNSALYSDWSYLYSFTHITSTTVSTSNLENTFNGRRYYKLELETIDGKSVRIDNVLSNGIGTTYPTSLGKTLTIEFPVQGGSESKPTLKVGSDEYVMLRANSGQGITFNPKPEKRYFQNHEDLYDSENAYSSTNTTPTVNADTVSRTATVEVPSRYTYVSMYIAAVGVSNLIAVYSQPTFLGIFRLPESF